MGLRKGFGFIFYGLVSASLLTLMAFDRTAKSVFSIIREQENDTTRYLPFRIVQGNESASETAVNGTSANQQNFAKNQSASPPHKLVEKPNTTNHEAVIIETENITGADLPTARRAVPIVNNTSDVFLDQPAISKKKGPINRHGKYPVQCGEQVDLSMVNAATFPLFDNTYTRGQKKHRFGHNVFHGPIKNGIELLTSIQVCGYATLEYFNKLAMEHNMRWSFHGGSLMSAICHSSINPWDDDIDLTVSSCETLDSLFSAGTDVVERFPDLDGIVSRFVNKNYKVVLLDDNFFLAKGPPAFPWFKLKSINETRKIPRYDFGGIDIMCFDRTISNSERLPMRTSGFRDYLLSNRSLVELEYGPTKAYIVPRGVVDQYVQDRYKKNNYCSFPFGHPGGQGSKDDLDLPFPAWQMEGALNLWYFAQHKRNEWLSLAGKVDGNTLKGELTNLEEVEVDNSIANADACSNMTSGRPVLVVGWNAERGIYWREFAKMIQDKDPDMILLNEMDLGMARSGNIHTVQQLGLRLGMNYAWGIEFVELTNGNWEEQNATHGKKNTIGLHGNAVLSKCPIYDAKIFRDALSKDYFTNKANKLNARGSEVRLGGRMALFARTGPQQSSKAGSNSTPHFIIGSVHKVMPKTHNRRIWDYLGFGTYPDNEQDRPPGAPQALKNKELLGVIASGDLESRAFCPYAGLNNLDRPHKPQTFPASCKENRLGRFRGDYFCGVTKVFRKDKSILPCFLGKQLSDHSIIEIMLEPLTHTTDSLSPP